MASKILDLKGPQLCMVPPKWYSKDCKNCWNFKVCSSYLKNDYQAKRPRFLKVEPVIEVSL